ncbi:MAG: hypothetical protein MK132_13935 [Lentisphaerales bacterium]|nr:hypothetical protein [Lentisphaerales bacterium]
MRSNLTVDASKMFHTKHLQAKEPTEKKLQNSISKYKKLESKKLIEILILLNQRDLALKLAEKHVPEDAITLYAKAGDVDSAIRIYTKNAKSMNAKLAISQVYLNCFDFDKIKTVLTHDILTQVKQNKLGDFLLPYSYTLNDEELLEKLDHWLAENPNNSYIIKKVLSHRYKISAYYLW